MKVSNKLHAPRQPHWDHPSPRETPPIYERHRCGFAVKEVKPAIFYFFFKHLFLNNCFALLKGTATRLSQLGNTNSKSTCLQSDPAQVNNDNAS